MAQPSSLKRIWTLAAIVVLAQLLVVQAMAASGAFHKCTHDHAGEPGHECVVTLMLEGGYSSVAPDITPVVVLASKPPPLPQVVSKPADSTPAHLVGGVLAHAPPRGP
jgi:multidrug efflux pump subunit AcrA (membrane-fusion protein)